MKSYSVLICATLLLASCGGGGGSGIGSSSPGKEAIAADVNPLSVVLGSAEANKILGSTKLTYPKDLVNDQVAMKRILGVDADNNGIRDDVDQFIAKIASTPEEKKYLEQHARSDQRTFLIRTTGEAYAEMDNVRKASACSIFFSKSIKCG